MGQIDMASPKGVIQNYHSPGDLLQPGLSIHMPPLGARSSSAPDRYPMPPRLPDPQPGYPAAVKMPMPARPSAPQEWTPPYETDLSKLAASSPISSVVSLGASPLMQKVVGGVGNFFSGVASPDNRTAAQKATAFSDQVTQRYAPAGARTTPQPSSSYQGGDTGWEAPASRNGASADALRLNSVSRMSDGTSTGQAAFAASQQASPAPPYRGARVSSGRAVPMTQPTVSWSDSPVAPVDPGPMISEVPQPAADFVANDYALPQGVSDNGGMATQGGRTFLLRQRTADEDAAYAQQAKDQATNPQNQGITVDKNGIAYGARDMSPGSQGAWEKKQELDEMLNRPFGLKVAKLANDQGTLAETIRNNSMNFGVNQQNARRFRPPRTSGRRARPSSRWHSPRSESVALRSRTSPPKWRIATP